MQTSHGTFPPGTHTIGNIRIVVNANDNGYTESFIVSPLRTVFSPEEFLNLFTDAELTTIFASTNAAMVLVRVKLQMLDAVDLNHPKVIAFLNRLVTASVINAARLVEINAGVFKQ